MVTAQWRILVALGLVLAGLPFAVLAVELVRHPSAWEAWLEWRRLALLTKNTVFLILGVVAAGLPIGAACALLLYRCNLPGKHFLRRIVILALFVPLPVLVSAWQTALGSGGWLTLPVWRMADPSDPGRAPTGIAWKPWAHGLPAAIWVHACAALPWFIWLAGLGFSHVERPLEEDALIGGGPWRAFWFATLPRAMPALIAATAWVSLLTANDVTVTDMMQVPTLAEEVYVQFARPDPPDPGTEGRDVLARALVVAVPLSLLLCAAIAWCWRRWESRLPPLALPAQEFNLIRLGWSRWPMFAAVIVLLLVLLGVPAASLVWRTGIVPPDEIWSPQRAGESIRHAWFSQRPLVSASLASAVVLGFAVSMMAAWACWLARERRWLQRCLFLAAAISISLPGPVLGIALKETIKLLVDAEAALTGERFGPVARLLYSGPSPLPVAWASGLRLWPCALALVWPVMRSIPAALFEQARLDGASPWQEWRLVAWPGVSRTAGLALIAVSALALGELSASKLVETPGGQTFAHEVFQQMHYGVGNHLAAMCLLLIGMVAGIGVASWITRALLRRVRQ